MQKVLVFGTFDSVHDGHRAMLDEAKKLGSYLIAVVAPDAAVQELKGKAPYHSAAKRIDLIKSERVADAVVLGDATQNSWQVIKKYKPAIIALGYDQEELKQSLEEYLERVYPDHSRGEDGDFEKNPKRPRIVILSPHKPDTFHNRIIHKKP